MRVVVCFGCARSDYFEGGYVDDINHVDDSQQCLVFQLSGVKIGRALTRISQGILQGICRFCQC